MSFWASIIVCLGPWGSPASICFEATEPFVGPDAQARCTAKLSEWINPSVVEHWGYDPDVWQEKMAAPNCHSGRVSNAAVNAERDRVQALNPTIYTDTLRDRQTTGKVKDLTVN